MSHAIPSRQLYKWLSDLIAVTPRVRLPDDTDAAPFGGIRTGEAHDFATAIRAYNFIENPSAELQEIWQGLGPWARDYRDLARIGLGYCLRLRAEIGPDGEASTIDEEPTAPRATRPRPMWEPDHDADRAAYRAEIEDTLDVFRVMYGVDRIDRLLADPGRRAHADATYSPLTLGPDELDPEHIDTVPPAEVARWQAILDTGWAGVLEARALAIDLAAQPNAEIVQFGPAPAASKREPEPVTPVPEIEHASASRTSTRRRWTIRGIASGILAAAAALLAAVLGSGPATATATPLPLSETVYATCPASTLPAAQPARQVEPAPAAPEPVTRPAAVRIPPAPAPRRRVSTASLIDRPLIVRRTGRPDLVITARETTEPPTGAHTIDADALDRETAVVIPARDNPGAAPELVTLELGGQP